MSGELLGLKSLQSPISGLVTTIIPVYNRAIFLREAVASVLAQTYRPIEVILVDDGSTDDTADLIAELVDESPGILRSIRIKNSGPGGAREAGRLIARGEYLQYLDSDDRLLPNKFQDQVVALQESPGCGIAYGKTRLIAEDGSVLVAPFKRSGERLPQLFPGLLVDRWWNTNTPLYRRAIADQVGPWPPTRMAEDWLYDARFGALGIELVYCDTFVADHRDHQQSRLTQGKLSPGALRDFGVLIPELFECAQRAGIGIETPEMAHFARWSFSLARQLGRAKEYQFATEALLTAKRADRRNGKGVDFRLFDSMRSIFGWSASATIVESLQKIRWRRFGADTMRQSWMSNDLDNDT